MRILMLVLIFLTSFKTSGQERDYIQSISDLLVFYYDNPQVKQAEKFRDSVIQIQPCPIGNVDYRELIATYIDRTHDKNQSYGSHDGAYYLELATGFDNDTINQFGFINYMEFALSNSEIDTLKYHQLADSIQKNSLNGIIPIVLRNQAYRLKLSNKVPNFTYELLDGSKVQVSKMKESYLLFEFPLPNLIPVHERPESAQMLMQDFQNIKVLRVSTGHIRMIEDSVFMNSFFPENLDLLIMQGSAIDDFFSERSSPRWILINKNLEIMSSDFDLRNGEVVQKLKSLLEADLMSTKSE